MAGITPGTEAANILRETWTSQFALDPTEESIVAKLVAEPYGTQKIGKKLHLRKIKAMTATKTNGPTNTTLLLPSNMTFTTNTEVEVTVTPFSYHTAIELNPDTLNEVIDDGELIAAYRKQMMAVLEEKLDFELLDLASSASLTETGASFTEAMWQAAIAKLAKNAKRKFRIGKTPYNLVFHPDHLASALQVPALREYQIRGNQGGAVNGQLVTTYGANIEETGLVKSSGGTEYMPLFIKDAWALGWNEKPRILAPQQDGLVTRFVGYFEAGCAEWFDSSIVSCNIT